MKRPSWFSPGKALAGKEVPCAPCVERGTTRAPARGCSTTRTTMQGRAVIAVEVGHPFIDQEDVPPLHRN